MTALNRTSYHAWRRVLTYEAILALGSDPSDCSLEQYQEQLADYKKDLAVMDEDLLVMKFDEDERLAVHSQLEKILFECSHQLKKQLASHSSESTPTSSAESSGVKLPKLDVPTFDRNILHWKQFWKRFTASVHDRPSLSNAEKLSISNKPFNAIQPRAPLKDYPTLVTTMMRQSTA